MARAQTGLEQLLAQSRQQSESTIFEEQFILHPHCESRMSLLCTFKIITKSPCFNGSGAARRPYHRANLFVLSKRWTNEPSFSTDRNIPGSQTRGQHLFPAISLDPSK